MRISQIQYILFVALLYPFEVVAQEPALNLPKLVEKSADANETSPPQVGYQLGNGDSIIIKIWSGDHFESGMSGEYIILSNGTIEIPIVGAINISNKNERAAADLLANSLQEYIINPIVQINIKSHNSQKIHVLGAVDRPGPIVMDRPITLLTALSKASLSRSKRHDGAWAAQKLYLQHEDGTVDIIPLDPLLQEGLGNQLLRQDDTIYVADGAYVYVNGKVEKPGGVPFRRGMTVTDALSHAGGTSVAANLKEVYILRNGKRIHVNVKEIFQGKKPDIDLLEGDRLFIEESIW
ncbi:MAG: hypothetical protein CL916_02655 [Deltaproteobacteria bacterium]|nr:hypothetical protein [Deltaproteobacteria bacterium]